MTRAGVAQQGAKVAVIASAADLAAAALAGVATTDAAGDWSMDVSRFYGFYLAAAQYQTGGVKYTALAAPYVVE